MALDVAPRMASASTLVEPRAVASRLARRVRLLICFAFFLVRVIFGVLINGTTSRSQQLNDWRHRSWSKSTIIRRFLSEEFVVCVDNSQQRSPSVALFAPARRIDSVFVFTTIKELPIVIFSFLITELANRNVGELFYGQSGNDIHFVLLSFLRVLLL